MERKMVEKDELTKSNASFRQLPYGLNKDKQG